ncbi:hypothetical protein [Lacisediminimonas sp.]|uniref:hypothetical protein n=1 Tax=Lacisediminimonas sp. TaxID=3060582 RepID=UPI00271D988A|nr:hypothetical protein [Lacisediminimonas sp.]MDO8298163.1 hypothetical protein [Lacisediminimonas sp.]
MKDRITGSTLPLPVTALRTSGLTPAPTKGVAGQAGSSPLVSSKPRLSAEELNKRADGLFNYTDLSQAGANALAEVLDPSGNDKAEVRESISRMRSYVTSYMLGVHAVKKDDFPFLMKFSRLWAQTSPEQRQAFQFGRGFDDFVADIRPPTGPSVVIREAVRK